MNVDRKITAGFWLLTLLPLYLGYLAWDDAYQLVAVSNEVADTNRTARFLEGFLSRLKDVQVAQREFVLTGDEEYVNRLERARVDANADLQTITAMGGRHSAWTALLNTLVPEKFDEINLTIALRRQGDTAGASNVLLANRGMQAMDDIRNVVNNMIREENRVLTNGAQIQDRQFVRTMTIFVVALILNVALIWSVFYVMRRESLSVRRLNEALEERVQQRTMELQRSNDELQQFAYVASHDMKEPMRMISSYSSLLERRFHGQLGEDADAWITFIVDAVRRMNALIDGLLDYSQAGQLSGTSKQTVNTESVLGSVIENLRLTIEDQKAEVTHDALPEITYDPVRLSQLLQNLVANALKYRSSQPPVVHVSARKRDSEIVFSVRDNGIGIAPEHQSRIFAIFQRLHGRDVDGAGIGLATCKKIVEEHGGRLWVESQQGEGSTFFFTVPFSRDRVHQLT